VRVVAGAAALVGGMLTAVATVAVAQDWTGWLLGLLATAALLHALAPGLRLRGLAAIGWVTGLVVVLLGRPEGDHALSWDPRGIGLLVAAVLAIGYAAVTLPQRG
jgi:hypothetical protein